METIRIKGAAPVRFEVHSTIWGPIITAPGKEPVFAVRWIAHLPEAVNLLALELESANTVEEVAEIANKAGMPVQNIVFADSRGRIGWTLMGKYPRRESNRSLNPISSSESPNTWERPMDATHYPIISDPIDGQIWSANNRHVGGAASFHIGDGKFAWASRAYQIREQLRNSKEATEEDMLAIQLDDSVHFLKRWRTLLLELLHGSSTFSVVLAQYPLLRRRNLSTYFERYYRNV